MMFKYSKTIMRFTHYLYIVPLALLAACNSSEDLSNASATTDPPNGAIELSAGIVEGSATAVTRGPESENHPDDPDNIKHQNFGDNTQFRLYVSGTWTGHGTVPTTDADLVYKTTTASKGAATGKGNLHNVVSFADSEKLYWDDYGTADANNTAGRAAGLTILGVAINGKNAPTVSSWTALAWTLGTNQTEVGNTPADKDLLISNNVQGTGNNTFDEGNYRFDQRTTGKLLEFKHALSKITVNLKAGDGFGGSFAKSWVELTSNKTGESNTEWSYTTGTINITTGAVSGQGNPSLIKMAPLGTAATGYTVAKEALVIPGSAFKKDAIIARINADGNIYYVNANAIRAAINSDAHDNDDLTQAGKNYIINVTVNKTDIVVTATVTDWTDVNSENVTPVINVSGALGDTGNNPTSGFDFSFYRSESLISGYLGTPVNDYLPEESVVSYSGSPEAWSMSPTLYWPNHSTHYQFRGVWPRTVTTTGDDVTSPRVETSEGNQVIKVKNVEYAAGSFPSDLMIARPEIAATTLCSSTEHDKVSLFDTGICATEGTINLNFRYMMSQVQVNLTTEGTTEAVTLTNAVVQIVGGKTTGDVKLGDRTVTPTGSNSDYTMHVLTGEGNENKRLDAIVPQSLTGLKFKITITNTDASTDVYYADVQPIKVQVEGSSETPAAVTAWESGKKYIYNLKLTKTAVKVTATITDWTTVTASDNVWF